MWFIGEAGNRFQEMQGLHHFEDVTSWVEQFKVAVLTPEPSAAGDDDADSGAVNPLEFGEIEQHLLRTRCDHGFQMLFEQLAFAIDGQSSAKVEDGDIP